VGDSSQFELHDDHVHEYWHRRAASFNDVVRGAGVQRITLRVQLAKPCQRILDLQQGTLAVVTHAAEKLFGRGAQIDHSAALLQCIAVCLSQNRAAPGGQDAAADRGQFIDRGLLDIAKGLFALLSNKDRMLTRKRDSITASVSANGSPSRFDNCRPTVDLPPPGMPTSAIRGAGLSAGATQFGSVHTVIGSHQAACS